MSSALTCARMVMWRWRPRADLAIIGEGNTWRLPGGARRTMLNKETKISFHRVVVYGQRAATLIYGGLCLGMFFFLFSFEYVFLPK